MAEKDVIQKGKIKQKGNFDFKDFYEFGYEWFKDNGYNLIENSYEEKISGDSKDIEINWECSKKISDYFKFEIKIFWRVLRLKKVKVRKEGKEVETNSGEVGLTTTATLIKDYENRWEDNPFYKFLRGIYEKYIIRNRITDYEDKLKEETDEFLEQIKSYLSVESRRYN